MKNKSNMKIIMLISSIICIALLITPVCNAGLGAKDIIKENNKLNIPKIQVLVNLAIFFKLCYG